MPREPVVARPAGPPAAAPGDQYEFLRHLVRERTGIVLEQGREYFIELRLAALASELGFESVPRLIDGLRTEERWGILHRSVAQCLAVTETSFFRDLHPFEALRNEVLPRLIKARGAARTLNVWCASVASGQEPYSLAMLIKEHFPELCGWKLTIIASDFSHPMLRRCKEGLYSQIEVNRGLPAPYLLRYFVKEGLDWRVRSDIRDMLQLRIVNLIEPWPSLPPLDLVLMRNVLIYFAPETRSQVLTRLADHMRSDGVLLLGGSEATISGDAPFEPVTTGRAVIHQPRGGRR
jgi:chemotaxis protein methyltransferase CheR